GQTTQTVRVNLRDNLAVTDLKYFTFNIATPTNATIARTTGLVFVAPHNSGGVTLLVGQVTLNTVGGSPVSGALVQACGASTCTSSPARTASDGAYYIALPGADTYAVTAFPSAQSGFTPGTPVPVSVTAGVNSLNVTAVGPQPIPTGVVVDGKTSGIPIVHW